MQILKYKKEICIVALLAIAFFAGTTSEFSHKKTAQVLAVSTSPTPFVTVTPYPTSVPVTIINNIILPTAVPTSSIPTPTPQTVATLTPTPMVIVVTPTPAMPTSMVSPTQIPNPTPTSTPTPVAQTATVTIDYAGEHAKSNYSVTITSGETAWQAVQDALGIANVQYTDYGGSLGIFITGFNGVNASSNQYYDFRINGTSSSVGVSSYSMQNHDALDFVLTSF